MSKICVTHSFSLSYVAICLFEADSNFLFMCSFLSTYFSCFPRFCAYKNIFAFALWRIYFSHLLWSYLLVFFFFLTCGMSPRTIPELSGTCALGTNAHLPFFGSNFCPLGREYVFLKWSKYKSWKKFPSVMLISLVSDQSTELLVILVYLWPSSHYTVWHPDRHTG